MLNQVSSRSIKLNLWRWFWKCSLAYSWIQEVSINFDQYVYPPRQRISKRLHFLPATPKIIPRLVKRYSGQAFDSTFKGIKQILRLHYSYRSIVNQQNERMLSSRSLRLIVVWSHEVVRCKAGIIYTIYICGLSNFWGKRLLNHWTKWLQIL